jgi:predicted RND superfamily exporter protein
LSSLIVIQQQQQQQQQQQHSLLSQASWGRLEKKNENDIATKVLCKHTIAKMSTKNLYPYGFIITAKVNCIFFFYFESVLSFDY